MKKGKLLTDDVLISHMNDAGWSVQDNGRVLCPVYGVGVSRSADGYRAYLNLRTGVRLILDTCGLNHVQAPPEVTVDDVRIISFEPADLRSASVLQGAADLIRELGETEGVLVSQGGHRNTVGVRTDGVAVLLEKAKRYAPRTVLFLEDPRPSERRQGGVSFIPALFAACAY